MKRLCSTDLTPSYFLSACHVFKHHVAWDDACSYCSLLKAPGILLKAKAPGILFIVEV